MDASATENVEKPHGKSKSCIQLFLTVTTIFLLVATIIFIGLFLYYYIQFVKIDKPTDNSISTTPAGVSTDTPTDGSICTTPDCVSTAALMLKNMNLSVDPCVDFNEFACGRYNREVPIPEGWTHFDKLGDQIMQENDLVMNDIITEDITTGQPMYLQKMKLFYKSCIDTEKIENTSLDTILNNTTLKEWWPTLDPTWRNVTINVNDLIKHYLQEYAEPLLFRITVQTHSKDTFKKIINIDQPTFLSYDEKFIAEAAIILGANKTTAEEDAKEFLNLANALYQTPNTNNFIVDILSQFSASNTLVDLPGAIRAVFETVNITLSDDEYISVREQLMDHLDVTLKKFSNRAIQNYFGFSYALPRLADMRYSLRRKAHTKLARWKTCLYKSRTYFWKAMTKQFVARKFSNETKVSVEKMIDNLNMTFKLILGETTWLESSTKTAALRKLAAMTSKVGYPDTGFTDEDINREYEQFAMDESTYYRNERLILEILRKKELSSITKPVDKTVWEGIRPFEMNAEYRNLQNSIVLPAAYLLPPNFSPTYPDALNYGCIGTIIGHEIIHAYDSNGIIYDAKGEEVNWWQPSDTKSFLDKVRCIEDQASQFKFDEVNMTLDGALVKREVTSDIGGVKLSYRAYKAFAAKKGENTSLPGLKLNYDQLFFLAFAQNWCQRFTLEGLKDIFKDGHPPGRFRIIGTLQNSEEFSKAYNCPPKSYMNPVKKCSVW